MSKRYLFFIFLGFVIVSLLSLVLGSLFPLIALAFFGIGFLVLVTIRLILRDRRLNFFVIFTFALSVAAALCLYIYLPRLDRILSLDGQYVSGSGQVVGMSERNGYYSFIVDAEIDELEGEKHKVYIRAKKESAPDMDLGRRITFSGVGEGCNSVYDKGNECFLRIYPSTLEFHPVDDSDIFGRLVYSIRQALSSAVSKSDTSALGGAMLLGDRTELSDEIEEAFRRVGTSHLLSLSGLHLSVIVMSFLSICYAVRVSHRIASLFSVILIFLYMLITGFSLSLFRAGEMLLILLFSRIVRRQRDGITSLSFAGLAVMLISPWSIFNISFQLSFLSTLGIIVFFLPDRDEYFKRIIIKNEHKGYSPPRHPRLRSFLTGILFSLYMTLSAMVFTTPFVLFYFNEISLFSLFGNLLTVALAQYYLQFLFFSATLSSLGSVILAFPFTLISDLLGKLLIFITSLLARISPPMTSLNFDYLILGIILITVIILAFLPFLKKRFLLPAIVTVLAVFVPLFNFVTTRADYNAHLVNSFVNSGVNTTLLRHQGKAYILDQTDSDSGKFGKLEYYLKQYNIDTVDEAFFVAMTSYPRKRIEEMLSFVDADKITVLSCCEDSTAYYEFLVFANSSGKDIRVEFCTRREILPTVEAHITSGVSTAFVVRGKDDTLVLYRSRNRAYINENLFRQGRVFFDGDNYLYHDNVIYSDTFPRLFARLK